MKEIKLYVTAKENGAEFYLDDVNVHDKVIERHEEYLVIDVSDVCIPDKDNQLQLRSGAFLIPDSTPVNIGIADIPVFEADVNLTALGNGADKRRDFVSYLHYLAGTDYRIYISLQDEGTVSIDEEIMNGLFALGMQNDLRGKYRYSYAAILEKGKSIKESIHELDPSTVEDERTYVSSAGYMNGSQVSIAINGMNYAVNTRGMNIVVYDPIKNVVVDSVAVDTYEGLNFTR